MVPLFPGTLITEKNIIYPCFAGSDRPSLIAQVFVVCRSLSDVVREIYRVDAAAHAVDVVPRHDVWNARFGLYSLLPVSVKFFTLFLGGVHSLVAVSASAAVGLNRRFIIGNGLIQNGPHHLRGLMLEVSAETISSGVKAARHWYLKPEIP